MVTLWGFEFLPGHQATLNADCPAPSIKTKTYTPGATQLHAQRKNSGSPRTTRVILSALLPFGSSHVTCGKPSFPPISSPFQTVQQRFACFLSERRSRAAARQHCSTFCSIFPSMRVVHTRPCIALRGAVTVRAPVRRPQTSARARQRRFLGRSKFFVFQLYAQQRHGVASALAACNALNLLRTHRQRPNRGSSLALFLTSTSSNRAPKQCQSLCSPMPPPQSAVHPVRHTRTPGI